MKVINLGHKDHDMAMTTLKEHPGCSLGIINDTYNLLCPMEENKVEIKEVVKADLVDILDTDGNDHITQKEVIEHFVKTKSVKKAVKILDEIDADNNGRITKKEVKDFVKKGDK